MPPVPVSVTRRQSLSRETTSAISHRAADEAADGDGQCLPAAVGLRSERGHKPARCFGLRRPSGAAFEILNAAGAQPSPLGSLLLGQPRCQPSAGEEPLRSLAAQPPSLQHLTRGRAHLRVWSRVACVCTRPLPGRKLRWCRTNRPFQSLFEIALVNLADLSRLAPSGRAAQILNLEAKMLLVLPVSQAVACLDFVWDQAPLVDRLVNVCLIQEELAREPIELSEAELQLAMDAFRRARGLATARDTVQWMARRGITHTELEALVGDEATIAKLRARIADGRVEAYFRMHQAEFDTAHIARIAFGSEAEALAATELARTGVLGFFAVAQSVFTADTLPRSPSSDSLRHSPSAAFEVLQRSLSTTPAVEAIFAAEPSEVVGPVWDGQAYILALVLSLTRAQLDASTHATIERHLFEEWLADRRAQADIEWFWWTTTRTNSPAPAAPAAA